jgi:N utilization substance protein B
MAAEKKPGWRRQARIVAFKVLFEHDLTGHNPARALEYRLAEEPLPPDAAEFARSLIYGTLAHRAELDEIIRRFAPAWPLEQMNLVDKNILRMALYEVLFENQVPVKAAINEAVELAKLFGTDASPKFINGVLGAVVRAYGRLTGTPGSASKP